MDVPGGQSNGVPSSNGRVGGGGGEGERDGHKTHLTVKELLTYASDLASGLVRYRDFQVGCQIFARSNWSMREFWWDF